MINNTNISNDCLYECKESICACIRESGLNINCDDIKNTLTQEIDINKFRTWFQTNTNNFKSKTNPHTYFKKAFLAELSKGKFEVEEISISTGSLMRAFELKGIIATSDDSLYAELMWETIIKAGMAIESVVELNHKIVGYMKKDQTFQDYVSLVKRSKAVKFYNVDWEKIQERYFSLLSKWDNMAEIIGGYNDEDD